jgi:mutator family transposase
MGLYHRGLEGHQLQLIVTDGCAGWAAALQTIYPCVAHQRCWVHKLWNLLGGDATPGPHRDEGGGPSDRSGRESDGCPGARAGLRAAVAGGVPGARDTTAAGSP